MHKLRTTALFFLLLALSQNILAQNLTPFKAKYNVYRGDSLVANAQFNLQFKNGVWNWTMQTQPTGLYRWLTRKKPFAQTQLQNGPEGIQLLLQHKGNYLEKPPRESSWFDHTNQTIYYKKGDKIKQLNLPGPVYDYHSIHLMHSLMLENNQSTAEVNFYKKGKILKSTLILEKQIEIPRDSSNMTVDKMSQSFNNSSRKIIYYYQGDTLAPLKIEQIKKGSGSSVMWRMDFE